MAANPLAEYNRKRDFKKTPEPSGSPAGKRESSASGHLFIVQKHDATRLHWDFRLEVDGVLKSWAVTKGPSPDPDIKRLAVRTEDHPMAYAEFEGKIPEGEYGGGSVMLWDKGTWEPVPGKSAKDLEKGHLHFTLHGERMKGDWLLIRLRGKPGEKRENWLLRKINDEYAEPGDALVEHGLTSVLTGRSMAEIEADKKGEHSLKGKRGKAFAAEMEKAAEHNQKRARKVPRRGTKPPKFRAPQLATLVDAVPAGNGWMHEIKFDGYRALIAAAGDKVTVYTRSGKDWSDKFEPLIRHFAALDLPPCLIDGEVVAYDAEGNPDFSSLQNVLKRGHDSQGEKDNLAYHAFDLLELNGEDLSRLPNVERKERLEALLREAKPPIHYADHIIGAGEKLFNQMCGAGQEGIISKRIDSPQPVEPGGCDDHRHRRLAPEDRVPGAAMGFVDQGVRDEAPVRESAAFALQCRFLARSAFEVFERDPRQPLVSPRAQVRDRNHARKVSSGVVSPARGAAELGGAHRV